MSLSKSKCWYSNNCLHILKQAVPLGVCQTHWSYAQIIYPVGFASQGVLNEDSTARLYGARSLTVSLIKSLTNS